MIRILPALGLLIGLAFAATAAEFKLADGTTLTGEAVSFSDQGAVFKLENGKFSERIQWFKFTPDSLKVLGDNPKAKQYVEPILAPPEVKAAAKKKPAIQIKQPPKPDLPPPGTDFSAALTTPIGLALLGILCVANLFAAYEVSVFRNFPVWLVCGVAVVLTAVSVTLWLTELLPRDMWGVSVLLPMLAPVGFLCLKSRPFTPIAPVAEDPGPTLEETVAPTVADLPRPGIPDDDQTESASLTLATRKKETEEVATDFRKLFKRGEYVFNRRFFETNFPGFFRVVPSEAEKDLVLVIKSVRGGYVGRRISRISNNELHLQVQIGRAHV